MRFPLAYPLQFNCRVPPVGAMGGAATSILALAVAVASLGGCLYTDPINRPPMIAIVASSAQILRGDPVTFSTAPSDPDGDSVTVQWVLDPAKRCPTARQDYEDERNWPSAERHGGMTYRVEGALTQDPFCVWAFATDRLGAVGIAEPMQIDPGQRPPGARIDIVEPLGLQEFPLYAEVKFSAGSSAGETNASYTWRVTPAAELGCAGDTAPSSACLTPDHEGSYTIELTVLDSTTQLSSTATRTVSVAQDQLPCIVTTVPDLAALSVVQNPSVAQRLSVSRVVDDGDPLPLPNPLSPFTGTPEFRWFIGMTAAKPEYVGNDQPTLDLAENRFSLGDQVTVRVEVRDRDKPRMDQVLSKCGDQPLCAGDEKRPVCFQRVTWTISFVL